MTSCGGTQTIVRTEYVYVIPPEQYIQTYDEPMLRGDKNRDLRDWAIDLREVNRLHQSDKRALKEWMEEAAE